MEQDNKYYIPTIDEFHVGFEFEYKSKPWTQITTNEEGFKILKKAGFKNEEFEDSWLLGIFNEEFTLPEIEENNIFGIFDALYSREHSGPRDFWDIKNRIKKEAIRVKYLDKNGIESLGWKSDEKEHTIMKTGMLLDFVPTTEWYKKPNFILIFFPTRQSVTFFTEDVTKLDYYAKDGTWPTIMEFPIKNKSELKQLMNKLNIE